VPYGISEAQILARLGRAGVQDISIDDLITLNGFLTAIKDGDSTPESVFAEEAPTTSDTVNKINETITGKAGTKAAASETKVADADTKGPVTETKAPHPDAAIDLAGAPVFTYAEVRAALEKAADDDAFAVARDMIRGVKDETQRKELDELAAMLATKG